MLNNILYRGNYPYMDTLILHCLNIWSLSQYLYSKITLYLQRFSEGKI